jgi:hypothetical protein
MTSVQSKLEFKLRLQEFIELVRGDWMIEAIMYARKHLASWGATNMKELQQAMATLAFKSNTDCPGYKVFSLVLGGVRSPCIMLDWHSVVLALDSLHH